MAGTLQGMTSADEIRTAVDTATVPTSDVLERARMIVVDKLGEWDTLGLDELVESVCEAYEAPSGEPLRVADVDPGAPDADSPALRNLRYSRAARTAIVDLVEAGTIVAVEPRDEDTALVGQSARAGEPLERESDDDAAVTPTAATAKETTNRAASHAGTDEVLVSVGPQPEGRRFALIRG